MTKKQTGPLTEIFRQALYDILDAGLHPMDIAGSASTVESMLDHVLQHHPQDYELLGMKGEILSEKGWHKEALPYLLQSVDNTQNPDTNTLLLLSYSLVKTGAYETALPYLERAFTNSDDFYTAFLLGYTLFKTGEINRAFEVLSHTENYHPDLISIFPNEYQELAIYSWNPHHGFARHTSEI